MAAGLGNGPGRPPRTSLTTKQVECIRLIVEEGKTNAFCQKTLSVTPRTWATWRAGPLFLPALEAAKKEYEDGVWDKLRSAASKAADTLISISNDAKEKGSVRTMAANSILDRGGYKKAEPIKATVIPYQTKEELIAAIASLPPDVLEAARLIQSQAPDEHGT